MRDVDLVANGVKVSADLEVIVAHFPLEFAQTLPGVEQHEAYVVGVSAASQLPRSERVVEAIEEYAERVDLIDGVGAVARRPELVVTREVDARLAHELSERKLH